MSESTELFQLHNGRYIASEAISDKMRYIKSVHPEYPPVDSTGYSWDEAGMADLFAECYMHDTRFCPEMKSWLTFFEGRWLVDTGSLLVAADIKEFVRLMALYCGEIEDEDKRKAYMGFVMKMGDRRFRDRIMKDAADVMRIPAAEFDSHPFMINCKNGTYDLKEGIFRQHDCNDYLTMQTGFEYTMQKVRCERWEQFIDEVTEGDRQKADFLQRALGYSILGTSNEECMFILHGKTTRNGKSTLLDAIHHLLGDYATVAPVELICRSDRNKNAEAPTSTLASLKGRRFVTMAESDSAGRLDESAIKQFTGGEEIKARELYQSAFTFKPQFTLWLSCNDLPAVRDKSLFASDRIRVIEFNRHFSDEEQDKGLKDYFESDEAMPGIFAWLVEGYEKYKRRGLEMPAHMKDVVRQYEKDNDYVLQFLEEKCEKKPGTVMKLKTLYDHYKIWARACGFTATSQKKFNAGLAQHPEWHDGSRNEKGVRWYDGLAVRGG